MDINWMKNLEDNSYSKALRIFGWVYIGLGVIGSFVIGNTFQTYYGDFNFALFLASLFIAGLFGALILGLAEIIRLLNDNRRLLASIAQGNDLNPANNIAKSIDEELPEI